MASLLLAAAVFLAIHLFVSGLPAVRGALVRLIGERPYLGLFSLASVGTIVWLAGAYASAEPIPLWYLGSGARHVALLVMPFALLLAIGSLTVKNPTAVGMAGGVGAGSATGILKITRHPLMWGIALWSLVHLAANGDAASLILFGTMLVLALVGPLMIDARRRRAGGDGWAAYEAATSVVPFVAIAAGRTRLQFNEIGWWRIGLALLLYVVLLWLHPKLFGVAVVY